MIRLRGRRRLRLLAVAGAAAFLGVLGLLAIRQYQPIPSSRQDHGRIREIRGLEPMRSGRVFLHTVVTDSPPGAAAAWDRDTIRYSLASPASRVEDAEIRGLLVGEPKYRFNQGTAYHMRLGRRFAGPSEGLYELKRGLARWELPPLAAGARLLAAKITYWVEGHDLKSPLAREGAASPRLHLYAYPIRGSWVEGSGGARRDNFSPAREGEVTWTHAREGQEPWPAPGALSRNGTRYIEHPVAVGAVGAGDRPVVLDGEALTRHVAARLAEGASLDLLLKLEDDEEDRWGTELGLMTSQFGDAHDAAPKRPRLDLVVEVAGQGPGSREAFVLEPGSDREFSPVLHPGRTVVLSAELEGDGGIPPGVEVRGGEGSPAADATWQAAEGSVARRWDWSQFRLRSPAWWVPADDTVSIVLHEFWVRPGPRQRQLPELVLIAPSGDLHRVPGRAGEGDEYTLSFRPEEPGLWRFGWSFRTTPNTPVGSHEGEGVFYATLPGGETGDYPRVLAWGRDLVEGLRRGRFSTPSAQVRVNALCRWAAAHAAGAGASERAEIERLVTEARAGLSR
jgi:hypothetical protein